MSDEIPSDILFVKAMRNKSTGCQACGCWNIEQKYLAHNNFYIAVITIDFLVLKPTTKRGAYQRAMESNQCTFQSYSTIGLEYKNSLHTPSAWSSYNLKKVRSGSKGRGEGKTDHE
jgi:hypothetical protein